MRSPSLISPFLKFVSPVGGQIRVSKSTKTPLPRIRASVNALLREFGGNDLKASWDKDSRVLNMSLYGNRIALVLKKGKVEATMTMRKGSPVSAETLRKEVRTALNKICGS